MRRPEEGMPAGEAEASLDALYRRYAAWLGRALRRRFGAAVAHSADDLVQEAYVRLAPYETVGVVHHPRAFLLRVASNLARDQLRRTARRGGASAAIEDVVETPQHATPAEQDETVLLKQLVMTLPPTLREVFVLSRFAGLTNQDVADRLGLSVKTVEWRMTKALTLLGARLRD